MPRELSGKICEEKKREASFGDTTARDASEQPTVSSIMTRVSLGCSETNKMEHSKRRRQPDPAVAVAHPEIFLSKPTRPLALSSEPPARTELLSTRLSMAQLPPENGQSRAELLAAGMGQELCCIPLNTAVLGQFLPRYWALSTAHPGAGGWLIPLGHRREQNVWSGVNAGEQQQPGPKEGFWIYPRCAPPCHPPFPKHTFSCKCCAPKGSCVM